MDFLRGGDLFTRLSKEVGMLWHLGGLLRLSSSLLMTLAVLERVKTTSNLLLVQGWHQERVGALCSSRKAAAQVAAAPLQQLQMSIS